MYILPPHLLYLCLLILLLFSPVLWWQSSNYEQDTVSSKKLKNLNRGFFSISFPSLNFPFSWTIHIRIYACCNFPNIFQNRGENRCMLLVFIPFQHFPILCSSFQQNTPETICKQCLCFFSPFPLKSHPQIHNLAPQFHRIYQCYVCGKFFLYLHLSS